MSLDEVDLPVDREARALVRIAGQMWNDTADGGFDGRTGDVYAQLRLQARGDGSREASICLSRDTLPDGGDSENLNLFEGDRDCDAFPDFVPEIGLEYTLSMSIDRAAGVLTYSVDDRVRSVSIGQPVFVPASDRRGAQVIQRGTTGTAVGSIHAMATDSYSQDFTTESPIIGPYRPFFFLERAGRSLDVVDGRARMAITSEASDTQGYNFQVSGETDRIEATLELSSESQLAGGSADDDGAQAQTYLGYTAWNDTAEGGFNESEGNVYSTIQLNQREGEPPRIDYCIFRSNTADFSDTLALLQQGDEECMASGIAAALDTSYAASLTLDRAAGTLRFAVDDSEFIYDIATPALPVADDRFFVSTGVRAWNGSTAVAYADDYRTSPDAPSVAAGTGPVAPVTDGSTPDEGNAGTGTDMIDQAGNPDATVDAEQESSGSGGGCTIAGRGGDGLTWLLAVLAGSCLLLRRPRRGAV